MGVDLTGRKVTGTWQNVGINMMAGEMEHD